MDEASAYSLLKQVMDCFYNEQARYPARVVAHKSPAFTVAETTDATRAFTEKTFLATTS
jgi:hypothetical protein